MSIEEERTIEKKLEELKAELAGLRREHASPVSDSYVFRSTSNERSLPDLFGGKNDLLVIHNMGTGCAYCTAYADGINGVLKHLEERTAVVLVSNDDPETLSAFAASRGWRFDVASVRGTSFSEDMGFEVAPGDFWPGVISFRREGSDVRLSAKTFFDPGDDLCVIWPLFSLLEHGTDNWEPKH